jgi:hypothetical protein
MHSSPRVLANHSARCAGNPDASLCLRAYDNDQLAWHASSDHGSCAGSVPRPRVARVAAPHRHSPRHSRSGHDRSGCRSAPADGTEHRETSEPIALRQTSARRQHLDATRNAGDNAAAFVPCTVSGTAPNMICQDLVGAVPISLVSHYRTASSTATSLAVLTPGQTG